MQHKLQANNIVTVKLISIIYTKTKSSLNVIMISYWNRFRNYELLRIAISIMPEWLDVSMTPTRMILLTLNLMNGLH